MRRFFAENVDISDGTVRLSGDESKHIAGVLRMKAGDRVILIDGKGSEWLAEILSADVQSVVLRLLEERSCGADPSVRVTLFQCLPKQGKMETIIQKCVELGVYRIVPTVSARCVVKPEGMTNKLARWNKVSVEAAKQCGRANVPEVAPAIKLTDINLSGFDTAMIAYENENDVSLKDVLHSDGEKRDIALIIGPEGGFEYGEVVRAADKGAVAVSLGKRILRTETAGMATVAQIMYELDQ